MTAPGSTSHSGVVGGLTVRHAVRTLPYGSALRWVSPPAILLCSFALRLVTPTTMASADSCPDRSRQVSPGKNAMLPCTTAAFTLPPEPLGLAMLCWLAPRLGLGCDFCSSARRFAVGLPSDHPSRDRPCLWLVVAVQSVSWTNLGSPTGDLHPISSRPCWAYTSRWRQRGSAACLSVGDDMAA